MQMGLMFGKTNSINYQLPQNSLFYRLKEYIDSYFAKKLENQKLVMSYYFFLNRIVVLWSSKKQKTMSILTIKAKYITFKYVARKIFWI